MKKILSDYAKALKAIDNIRYQARSLRKVDRAIVDVALLALTGLQGKTEEARFHVSTKRPQLKPDWAKKLTKDAITKLLDIIGGDGHSIFPTYVFKDVGLPRTVVRHFVDIYPSDIRNPKSTIFSPNGTVLSHMRGMYGLDVLRSLASSLDAASSASIGRGSEARELTENIKNKLLELFPA